LNSRQRNVVIQRIRSLGPICFLFRVMPLFNIFLIFKPSETMIHTLSKGPHGMFRFLAENMWFKCPMRPICGQ